MKRKLADYEVPHFGTLGECTRGIKPDVCQGPIKSMPRQVEATIKSKGGYTKHKTLFIIVSQKNHLNDMTELKIMYLLEIWVNKHGL